jgi:hypothetical protein
MNRFVFCHRGAADCADSKCGNNFLLDGLWPVAAVIQRDSRSATDLPEASNVIDENPAVAEKIEPAVENIRATEGSKDTTTK